jgi:hypothetical protein
MDKTKEDCPREIGWLTVLSNHEIITKFNQFMLGFGNYYIPEISTPSKLGRWHYFLYYSCIKTLAAKNKLSTKAIINKYGYRDISVPQTPQYHNKTKATDLRICIKYEVDNKPKWAVLLNYKEWMYKLLMYRQRYKETIKNNPQNPLLTPPIDFMSLHKVNFRTKFKLTTACTVCGATEDLQNHHIKPIKHGHGKFTGYKGFDKLVASLGRKQVTVCSVGHKAIHSGTYSGMSLEDLHDVRLAAPESYFKNDTSKYESYPNTQPRTSNSSGGSQGTRQESIFIYDSNRTYLNVPYQNYLKSKYVNKQVPED